MPHMINKIITAGVEETEAFAKDFASALKGGETVALFGGMGMGKTAFTRGMALGLDVDCDEISSPTFAIMHEHSGRVRLCHYDMYRIESWEDLESTGFFESVGRAVNVIEWSENIENALPLPRWEIRFSAGETPDSRVIEYKWLE